MTIDHNYPYQHEWHLVPPVGKNWSDEIEWYIITTVWVCQCGAMKRHVFREHRLFVYDPEGLQDHKHEMDYIELVDDIP